MIRKFPGSPIATPPGSPAQEALKLAAGIVAILESTYGGLEPWRPARQPLPEAGQGNVLWLDDEQDQ